MELLWGLLLLSCVAPAICTDQYTPVAAGFSKSGNKGEYTKTGLKDKNDKPFKITMKIDNGKADFKVEPENAGDKLEGVGEKKDGYFYVINSEESSKVPENGWQWFEDEKDFVNQDEMKKRNKPVSEKDSALNAADASKARSTDEPGKKRGMFSKLIRGIKNFFRRLVGLKPKN